MTAILALFVGLAMTNGDQVFERARKSLGGVRVSVLDAKLGDMHFNDWLTATIRPARPLRWSLGDCDLRQDYREPKEGYPVCAHLEAATGQVPGGTVVKIMVLLGHRQSGLLKSPEVNDISVMRVREPLEVCTVSRLSQLSGMLRAISDRVERGCPAPEP